MDPKKEESFATEATKSEETVVNVKETQESSYPKVTGEADTTIPPEATAESTTTTAAVTTTENEEYDVEAGVGKKEADTETVKEETGAPKKLKFRPVAFLLGLPFALVSLVITFVATILWIVGMVVSIICPCCCCVALLAEMALGCVNLPFVVIQWFTDKIPF